MSDQIPEEAKRLYDFAGYFDVFYEIVSREDSPTHYQAYLELEERYIKFFGKNRYRTYESFRVTKCRYMKLLSQQRVNKVNMKSV